MSEVQRHALTAGGAGVLTRISGLLREVVFASVFGAGVYTDAFIAAQRVPNLFRDLFAEGSMASAFIPTLSETLRARGKDSAWLLANAFLGLSLTIIGLLTFLMILFAPQFVWLVAAGFTSDHEKTQITINLIRLMAPFLACVNLASAFGAILNIQRKFFLPTLAPAAFNLAVIFGALLAQQLTLFGEGIYLVAAAATAGGALQFIVQLPALHREGFSFRPTLRGHPDLIKLIRFLVPALIGISAIQLGILIDLQLASSLGDGPASWLNYAFRIVQLPMTLFAGAAGIASLALISDLVAQNNREEARTTLEHALSLTSFFVAPSAVFIGLFSVPIVQVLFERGAFNSSDTQITAQLLSIYAAGVLAFSAHRILTPALFAWKDPWTPMVLTIGSVLLKLPLAIGLTHYSSLGIFGIPSAHVIVATLESILLGIVLIRKSGKPSQRFWTEQLKIVITLAIVTIAITFIPTATMRPSVSILVMLGAGIAYLGMTHLLGLPYTGQVLGRLSGPRGQKN
jgi:putative peptidoglycan lipid II flippase